MKIQTPHDSFFKETIGKIEVAEDFLNNYLPEGIRNIVDTKTLEPQKDSFIDKELNETFADMLFKANIYNEEGYIYFLFEHKSYTSKNVSLQLLKYMTAIWDAKIKNEKKDELPVILPLLIYHGRYRWNAGNTLGNIIKGYENLPDAVKEYIPNYEYLVYDISRYTDDEIKGSAYLRIMLTILRDIFTKDEEKIHKTIMESIEYIKELEDKQSGIEYFETMMRYIFSTRTDLTKETANEIMSKLETNYPEGSEVMMTLAEKFRNEGLEQGMMKGIEEGRRKEKIDTAIKLLIRKFGFLPKNLKEGIRELDSPTLEVIIDGIFETNSLDDIKKYLP
mgnify:CR=1 FL=1